MPAEGALQGLRVLDLSQNIAGPYCTRLLAALGARVIKIEPPGTGDRLRSRPPFAGDTPGLERGAFFLHLNGGKQSVALDLKTAAGRETLLRLAASADVVLESFAPGTMARLGLDFEALNHVNSRLVLTSISNFGQRGPYRDHQATEIVFMALGGFMSITGEQHREPVKLCGAQAQYQAGLHAAIGTLSALSYRDETGTGQWVDVSIAESVAFLAPAATDAAFRRSGNRAATRRSTGAYPSTTLRCKDGYVHVHYKHWAPDALALLTGEPRLAAPELLAAQMGHADEIDGLLERWLLERSKIEVLQAAQEAQVPFGAVLTVDEVMTDAQHAARGFFASVEHPELGAVQTTGAPMRLSRTPWFVSRPPLLGEHTREVLTETRQSRAPVAVSRSAVLPLSNVRVLDLTQILAGPCATQVLADLGAEVIKIESHTRPDRSSGAHNALHRNKLGLCLNLSTTSGKQVFKRLVCLADVVIDNFRPRVMGNLGLGYPVLSAINPAIVQVSMPAFGSTGPYKDFVMVGPGIDAMSGLQQLTGYPDGIPLKLGSGYTDQTTALNTVIATVAALQWRRGSGIGQHVEVAMREALTPLMGEYVVDCALNGRLPQRSGNRSSHWAPQGCYRSSGEDRWVALSVRTDEEWGRLCDVIGRPELSADPRYAAAEQRQRNHDALDQIIGAWTSHRTHLDAMEVLQAAGIPAGAVLTPLELLEDPGMRARGHFAPGPDPEGGEGRYAMPGFRLPASPVTVRRPPCGFGEHTQPLLRDMLGLLPAAVASLYEDNTIADAPVRSRSDLPARESIAATGRQPSGPTGAPA